MSHLSYFKNSRQNGVAWLQFQSVYHMYSISIWSKISVLLVSHATFKNNRCPCVAKYIDINLPVYIISAKMCDLDLWRRQCARIRARSIIKLKCHFAKVARGVIFSGDFPKNDITDSAGRERELLGSGASFPSVKDIGRFRELPEREMERERERERETLRLFSYPRLLLFRVCLTTRVRASLRSRKLAKQSAGSVLRCGKTDGALLSYIC